MSLAVKVLSGNLESSIGDSGYDLRALTAVRYENGIASPEIDLTRSCLTLEPNDRVLIKTGIKLQFLDVHGEAQIRPRSGLSLKYGIYVAFGTIDANYTGDIGVILTNQGKYPFTIEKGDRIAQLVFSKVVKPHFVSEVKVRDEKGFGSSGVK